MSQEPSMPFTGEHPDKLERVLMFITSNPLCLELFDAFLSEYKTSGDLDGSLAFARSEWDT